MGTASIAIIETETPSPIGPSRARIPYGEGVARSRYIDHRRSPRVTLDKPLPCFLHGYGHAEIRTVSLGGASLVSSFRPDRGGVCRVRFAYGDGCVDAKLAVYRTVVDELFYSSALGSLGSRARYTSCATFDDPSVATLNLLYRIIGDHWVDSGDDDTEPLER